MVSCSVHRFPYDPIDIAKRYSPVNLFLSRVFIQMRLYISDTGNKVDFGIKVFYFANDQTKPVSRSSCILCRGRLDSVLNSNVYVALPDELSRGIEI